MGDDVAGRPRRARRISLLAGAAAASAAIAVGCGSSSDTGESSASASGSKSEGAQLAVFYVNGSSYGVSTFQAAEAQAKKLGVKVEYVETPWDSIFAGLTSSRFDVILNQVTKNPEREGLYGLSRPYTVSQGVIATRADDSSITSLGDLKGRKTAQSLTSNWAKVAKDAGADVEGAAKTAWVTRMENVGQACNSNKRMIVMDDIYDDFVAALVKRAAAMSPRQPGDDSPRSYSPMVSRKAAENLLAQVQDAVSKGAPKASCARSDPTPPVM